MLFRSNRLDRNTSGIVLCGKSFPGLQFFSQCVRERSVRKFYRTICVGALREAASIEGHLVKDSAQNRVIVTAGNVLAGEERQSNQPPPLGEHGGGELIETFEHMKLLP